MFCDSYNVTGTDLRLEMDCKFGQNICRLFQDSSTTSEAELDYYDQKVNIRDVSQVVERFKA